MYAIRNCDFLFFKEKIVVFCMLQGLKSRHEHLSDGPLSALLHCCILTLFPSAGPSLPTALVPGLQLEPHLAATVETPNPSATTGSNGQSDTRRRPARHFCTSISSRSQPRTTRRRPSVHYPTRSPWEIVRPRLKSLKIEAAYHHNGRPFSGSFPAPIFSDAPGPRPTAGR